MSSTRASKESKQRVQEWMKRSTKRRVACLLCSLVRHDERCFRVSTTILDWPVAKTDSSVHHQDLQYARDADVIIRAGDSSF